MECKSIQCSSSSGSGTTWKHDVFVSFRGEDIRHSFADHLFGALKREGIVAFRDDRNLKQGEHISTELMQAIEGSHVLIVVFSKNYATSSWCLDELAKIVDCMNTEVPTRQTVLPIFYDVSPSEVRRQSGNYGKAFAKHEKRFKQDLGKVQRWREALVQMANLSGSDVKNKAQYEEIENIVKRVKSILCYKLSSLDGLVGMYPRVQQLEKLLDIDSNDDVRVVGICGMGRIGNTTLARAVYDRNFHQYDVSCFIDDIGKLYHDGGPIATQKQLLCQIQNEEIQDMWNVSRANYLIKTRLCHKKALIVLDNVDKVEQVEKLGVNREYLCAGSRMIIISRDRHILNNYGVDDIHVAELLNDDEALQLFCRKAFKCDHITSCDDINREYGELADLALEYVQCLPLAIEVLGSFLHGRDIFEWRSALTRLRNNPKKEIMEVLQMSFDGLDPMEKDIFLDIACFFHRFETSYVKQILDCCGFHSDIGIRILIDKSLIIESNNRITMHDMLKELGMNIVRQKAPNVPAKWSRIWQLEDYCDVMHEKMAMDNLEAIVLTPQTIMEEHVTFRAEALSRMNRLRLLIICGMNFSGSLNCLSNRLRFLTWTKYPFTYFPSSCELINLVELCLRYSNINQLWEGIKPLYKLKLMNLEGSESLVRTPNFTGIPNLERLDLGGCTKLVHIHPSIGLLRKLVYLNLEDCTSLTSLPNSIFDVTSLESVILSGCSKICHSELSENARHGTSDIAVQCQSTTSFFKRLKLMWPFHLLDSTRHNDIVGSLMPSLARFYCLQTLNISYCSLLNIPEGIALLYCLEMLDLQGNNFVTLPCFMKKLPRLKILKLDHCKQLTSLSEFPINTVFPVGEKVGTVELSMFNCPKLDEMESLSSSALSWMIHFLEVHKESSPQIILFVPGTQIPSWFSHQGVGESVTISHPIGVGKSIPIRSFLDVHDSNWIGIAFCALFTAQFQPACLSSAKDERSAGIECSFRMGTGHWEDVIWQGDAIWIRETDWESSEWVHICLLYFTRQELIPFLQRANMDSDGFSFNLSKCYRTKESDTDRIGWDFFSFEVKKVGVRVVFKHDLEEFNGAA